MTTDDEGLEPDREADAEHDARPDDHPEHEDANDHDHSHKHDAPRCGVVEADVEQAAAWLAKQLDAAERVLIGAGAGLSVAAGIDYGDEASFAELFPAFHRRGFRARYQMIGYPGLSPEAHWGYWATHVDDVRFRDRAHPAYATLYTEVADIDYFVLTSNVDAMFVRNGFDPSRIWTPQGDYALMQCLRPCRRVVWPSEPIIKRALAATDPVTQEVTDPNAIPRCPNCGGPVFLNVNAGRWFLTEPYQEQLAGLRTWLSAKPESPLLVLEIGAGMNTPTVVRYPLERLVVQHPNATMIRINPDFPGVPPDITDRAVGFDLGSLEVIEAVARYRARRRSPRAGQAAQRDDAGASGPRDIT